MATNKFSSVNAIRRSYKKCREYLKRAGIEIEGGIRFRVLESLDLLDELYDMIKTSDINELKQELNTIDKSLFKKISNYDDIYIIKKENLREFYISEIYLLRQIYNTDDINELNKKIIQYILHPIENEKIFGMSLSEIKEIYIIKDQLEKGIDEILNRLGPININGPSIIRLGWPLFGVASAPLYTEGKNIEKDVKKASVANNIIHEMIHIIVNRELWDDWELSVSALQYIIYVDMYNLLKYPKTYEIIKENIKACKKYVEDLIITDYLKDIGNIPKDLLEDYLYISKITPNILGECYANIIIDRNKKTSYLNIKDVIEEVKNLSISDAKTKIISYRPKK
jgi:hypothetical protein